MASSRYNDGLVTAAQLRSEATSRAIGDKNNSDALAAWKTDSPGQVAYAEVKTGVITSFAGTATVNTGCNITVPPTTRDVWIQWGCYLGITTPNDGAVTTAIYDTTGPGAPVLQDVRVSPIKATDPATASWQSHNCEVNVGPSTSWRNFALYGVCSKTGASYPTVYFENNFFGYGRSWIAAVVK